MDLVQSPYQSGSEPELLELRFPDYLSQGEEADARYPQTPRIQWKQLATEKAAELGIEFGMRNTADGLQAVFHTADDCNALVAAMQPEWHGRLMKGLQSVTNMETISDVAAKHQDPGSQTSYAADEAVRLGKQYGLDEDQVSDLMNIHDVRL